MLPSRPRSRIARPPGSRGTWPIASGGRQRVAWAMAHWRRRHRAVSRRRFARLRGMRIFTVMFLLAALVVLTGPTSAGASFPGRDGNLVFPVAAPDASCGERDSNLDRYFRAIIARGAPLPRRCSDVYGWGTYRASGSPDWSPDGRRLVYAQQRWPPSGPRQEFRLLMMNADGSDWRVIPLRSRNGFAHPTFAPDGRHIAVERYGGQGGTRVWRLRTTGRQLRQLAPTPPARSRHQPSLVAGWENDRDAGSQRRA